MNKIGTANRGFFMEGDLISKDGKDFVFLRAKGFDECLVLDAWGVQHTLQLPVQFADGFNPGHVAVY